MQTDQDAPLYTWRFAWLCLSSLLFSASFNMIIPELPDYLSSLGGAEYKGLIIALFTLTAGISRPFSGKWTDKLGRVPMMAVGSFVCVLCGFLYPILTSVSGFLFLRLIHGFSTGFKPTATSAYIADIVPKHRWGEALGMHGLSFSIGMAIGPAIGSEISRWFSLDVLFYASSGFALLSILIIANLKETLPQKPKFSMELLKISRKDIFDWAVLPAAIVTLLYYFAYGVILTLVPDWTGHIGLANKGLFFTFYTVSSLLIRLVSGKLSDRKGRVVVMKYGLLLLMAAMLVLAYGDNPILFFTGASLYGFATGIVSPALSAWVIDLSVPEFRGRALATGFIALEAGIGLGALLSGFFYQDIMSNIPLIFAGSAGLSGLAFIYLMFWNKKLE